MNRRGFFQTILALLLGFFAFFRRQRKSKITYIRDCEFSEKADSEISCHQISFYENGRDVPYTPNTVIEIYFKVLDGEWTKMTEIPYTPEAWLAINRGVYVDFNCLAKENINES